MLKPISLIGSSYFLIDRNRKSILPLLLPCRFTSSLSPAMTSVKATRTTTNDSQI
jgi:hypothetical protein